MVSAARQAADGNVGASVADGLQTVPDISNSAILAPQEAVDRKLCDPNFRKGVLFRCNILVRTRYWCRTRTCMPQVLPTQA